MTDFRLRPPPWPERPSAPNYWYCDVCRTSRGSDTCVKCGAPNVQRTLASASDDELALAAEYENMVFNDDGSRLAEPAPQSQSPCGMQGGEGCGQQVSVYAESCPRCGFPVGRQMALVGELMGARENEGLTQLPEDDDLFSLSLAQLESWVAWARGQTQDQIQATTLSCPRCGSTWVNVPESIGNTFKRSLGTGLLAGLFGMGVIVQVDDGAYSCSNCSYRWVYK